MRSGRVWKGRSVGGGLAAVFAATWGMFGIVGCASEPKEPPPRSVDQIRGDSDRFFDRALKQEERERSKGPAAPADPPVSQGGR